MTRSGFCGKANCVRQRKLTSAAMLAAAACIFKRSMRKGEDMSLLDHYTLDEQGNPVLETDLIKWAIWFGESMEQRRVGSTELGDIHISTVFLGSVHVSKDFENDNEMLYETMVFGTDAHIARLMEISETDDRSIFTTFFGGFDIQKRY